jgi:hypothetical protein
MSLTISLQTIRTTSAGTLKAIQPDVEGYYRGIPLMVLGAVSRNNMFYEPTSVVNAMTNPKSRFYRAITGGGLEGEWGHPSLVGLDDDSMLRRLADVDLRYVSHQFGRIYTETSSNGNFTLLRGDVKAAGPYGKFLTESFADANRDTCFSLRSLTSHPVKRADGVGVKKVLNLITYDYVSVPGYEEASKRGALGGCESLNLMWEDQDLKVVSTESLMADGAPCTDIIGYESINCQEVLDILGSDHVSVTFESQPIGTFDSKTGRLTGRFRNSSTVHALLQKGLL